MSLVDILRKSKLTRFFLVPLFSAQLAVFPMMPIPKAEADTKRQIEVNVDNTPYLIDPNNIVKTIDENPIENEKIVRKALVTKRVLDTLKVDDLDKLYRQFKTEKILVDVFKNLSWVLTLEAKLLKYVLAIGDYPTLSTLTVGDILTTARQIANNPKRNLLHLISNTYEEIDSRMKRLRVIRNFAIKNNTLTYYMATEALSHKGFRRIYQQPTFNFFRRIQNQEFLVGEWTNEFYQPLLEIAKRTNTNELLDLASRKLKQFLSRYDAYNLFIIEFGKSREKARLERKEFDEAIEKLVDHHSLYISQIGLFHRVYMLRCDKKAGLKDVIFNMSHSRLIKKIKDEDIERNIKKGLSKREAEEKFYLDLEGHDAGFKKESEEKICIKPLSVELKGIYRHRNFAIVKMSTDVFKDPQDIIGVLKKEKGIWQIYDMLESGGYRPSNETIEKYWSEWTQRLRTLTAQ